MASKQAEKMAARKLYVAGASPDEIALRMGVDRATIYRWMASDKKKKGIDWDKLRLQEWMDKEAMEVRHRNFLNQIFACFETDLPEIAACSDAKSRLEWLDRYSSAYYKLMNAAKREMPKVGIAEIAGRTLEVLVSLAGETGQKQVLQWVQDHLDEIKAKVEAEVAT